jgi:hypothetical protein
MAIVLVQSEIREIIPKYSITTRQDLPQLVQLYLIVIVNITTASTYKEHQLRMIEIMDFSSFETRFY